MPVGAAAAIIGMALRSNAKRSPAVAKLMQEAVAKPAKPGTRAYYLARLERDHTALASRVHSGELSVYCACIEAGIRKAPKKSAKWTKVDAYMKPELLRRNGESSA